MVMPEPPLLSFVGHTYEVNFGNVAFQNTFDTETRLTYVPLRGALGETQTVDYQSVQVKPNAFFQFWQEKDGTTVSRYIDFEQLLVYGNITLPDHKFLTLKGTLKRIK